jgi:purine-nucleoside phosphorylase
MPTSAIQGHAGNFCGGFLGTVPVLCMQGRVHSYEGYSTDRVVFGACLLRELGCTHVLLTNAAGGIAADLAPGDLMLITDHINLSGQNPLVGPHDGRGARFPDMTHAYDPGLRELALGAAVAAGVSLKQGVYASLLGPTYETPAEVRMLARLGADAVGMSTALEVIALGQLGARAAAISCITNLAAGISKQPLSHDEVEATAKEARDRFTRLLTAWIEAIARP